MKESEKWLPGIPLKHGYYSDTGYRFRRNYFQHVDSWLPWSD